MILHHYHLELEVSGTDRQNLAITLEDHRLDLEDHLGDETSLAEQVQAGHVRIGLTMKEPIAGFESDIALLSSFLHQVLRGLEVEESVTDPPDPTKVRAEKILGRLGETIRIPLRVEVDEGRLIIDPDADDLGYLESRWHDLPLWVQNGMRIKYPRLRRL
ncbi:MAG: hypothetical protein RL885_12780 [Planctomycetota bacterium]